MKTLLSLALGLLALLPLSAAELATDFPKPPIPLELAPRMGRPFNDLPGDQNGEGPPPGEEGVGAARTAYDHRPATTKSTTTGR